MASGFECSRWLLGLSVAVGFLTNVMCFVYSHWLVIRISGSAVSVIIAISVLLLVLLICVCIFYINWFCFTICVLVLNHGSAVSVIYVVSINRYKLRNELGTK